jgi:hypothetical protein
MSGYPNEVVSGDGVQQTAMATEEELGKQVLESNRHILGQPNSGLASRRFVDR